MNIIETLKPFRSRDKKSPMSRIARFGDTYVATDGITMAVVNNHLSEQEGSEVCRCAETNVVVKDYPTWKRVFPQLIVSGLTVNRAIAMAAFSYWTFVGRAMRPNDKFNTAVRIVFDHTTVRMHLFSDQEANLGTLTLPYTPHPEFEEYQGHCFLLCAEKAAKILAAFKNAENVNLLFQMHHTKPLESAVVWRTNQNLQIAQMPLSNGGVQ